MKILVLGQGGREHAIVRALYLSPSVTELHCIPGNDGMKSEAFCHDLDPSDHKKLLSWVQEQGIDLVVVGPEKYLSEGVVDVLRSNNVLVFGPNKFESQLESSKTFAKQFMESADIPTAKYQVIKSIEDLKSVSQEFSPPWVIKVDGLASGKGVFICKTQDNLMDAGHKIFTEKVFGSASDKVFIEEFLDGYELSLLLLTNGTSYQVLPVSQDHKALLENGEGPNTGGMGAVAPMRLAEPLYKKLVAQVFDPIMEEFEKKKMSYRGILYVGLMIHDGNPYVLEFNARFGDPEAQAVLPLLDGDWGDVFKQVAKGNVPNLAWKQLFSCVVVSASKGYPVKPIMGTEIQGDLEQESPVSYFLHAGTRLEDSTWKTHGGRVLNSIGLGVSLEEAIQHSYRKANLVSWSGLQMRKDIGLKAKEFIRFE